MGQLNYIAQFVFALPPLSVSMFVLALSSLRLRDDASVYRRNKSEPNFPLN